jgi:hypothetical protein
MLACDAGMSYTGGRSASMTSKCSRATAAVLALAAWVMPFVATPLHLYCAHSYHEDCPACRMAKRSAPRGACRCCCGFCLAPGGTSRASLSKEPPGHNHEFCDSAGRCSICEVLSTQYRICAPKQPCPLEGRFTAPVTPESRVRMRFGLCFCILGRAPPFPSF